jgi:hypothetical protein
VTSSQISKGILSLLRHGQNLFEASITKPRVFELLEKYQSNQFFCILEDL